MATKIYINTDLKDLTANAVANKNRPTQVVRLPQIVEGETLDVELSLVNSGGGYDTRSGDATVSLAVAVSARGAAATSGTFTLTASTETTAPLAWNASAEAVEGALNALNSGSGAYGSKVDVKKLNSGSYRIIFKDVGARTDFGGTSIDLAPESEVTIATAVVGSATIRAQMIIEISQQPAIYTSTWTTGSSKFSGQLNANTARVQELIATGQDAFFEVKADDDVICQVPIAVLPAVAAPNSLPAHTLPSNLNQFANDPSTNGNFNAANWLTDLGSPENYAVWGNITGTLSNQTDLKAALDAKAPITKPNVQDSLTVTATVSPDEDAKVELIDKSTGATKRGGLYKKDGALYVGTYTDYLKNLRCSQQGSGQVYDFPANSGIRFNNGDLLEKYNEGTFLPKLESGDGTIVQSVYQNRQANYVRIGDLVQVNIRMEINNFDTAWKTSTKNWKITDLPYDAIGNHNMEIRPIRGWMDLGNVNITGALQSGNDYLWVEKFVNNGTTAGQGANTSRINANSFAAHPFNFSTGSFEFIITGAYKTNEA